MEDIKSLVNELTVKEKAQLVIGKGPWQTVPIERLNIPSITVADGPHGVRRLENIEQPGLGKTIPATCFPPASSTAATWNTALLERMGQHLGDECLALDIDILLGPGVNIKRTPLCGRNFEYFSEDPFLAGKMATALVKGIQSKGIGTSVKHFTANNQEYERHSVSANIDERTLREIYLPAFERVVKEAQPYTIMCAYNKLNGIYCSEHYRLLQEILRDDWGFKGFVVSDWGAVNDPVASIQGSLDLQMPGPHEHGVKQIVEAVENGKLGEEQLDLAVERILNIVFKAKSVEKGHVEIDNEKHHAFAKQVATESIVLLKNEAILPLKKDASICILGRLAKNPSIQAGGSADLNPTKVVSPLEAIKDVAEKDISYADGYSDNIAETKELKKEAVELAKESEVVIIFAGYKRGVESEGYDRKNILLPDPQVALIKAIAKEHDRVVVVLNNGSAVSVTDWIRDVPALVEMWLGGQAIGEAIADILFGKVNPSGKLPETFPKKLSDNPAFLNYPGEYKQVQYGERFFVGYRYYDKKDIEPQFPFGFGLSYTTFEYSNLRISKKEFADEEGLTVNFDITNTGIYPGKEIAQLYIHQHNPKVDKPVKELKGFSKVELQPNETKTVRIDLTRQDFAYYDTKYNQWIAPTDKYDLLVGSSSQDIKLKTTVSYQFTKVLPSILNEESTLRDWLQDPKGKKIVGKFFEEMRAKQGIEVEEESRDNWMMEHGLNLPLFTLLGWMRQHLDRTPTEIVKELLKQVK